MLIDTLDKQCDLQAIFKETNYYLGVFSTFSKKASIRLK
jgi:hypothetical protein